MKVGKRNGYFASSFALILQTLQLRYGLCLAWLGGYKWGRDSTALTGSVVEDHTKLMVRSIMFDKYFTKHLRSHKPGQQGAWESQLGLLVKCSPSPLALLSSARV